MGSIFGIVGVVSILASFAAAAAIKSDIQIILACVLFLGGMNLVALTAVLNRMDRRVSSAAQPRPAAREDPRL